MSQDKELRQAILDNFDYFDKGREQATDAIQALYRTREATLIREAKIEELKLINKATLGKSITPENNNDPTWQGGLRFARNTFKRYKLNRITELTNQQKGDKHL